MIKTVFLGLILGSTLGVALAAEIFMRIGMEAATFQIMLAGLLIATLLVNRGVAVVAAVIALTISIFQPDKVLLEYGFDRDILMAAILLVVIYPVVRKVMHS